MYGDLFLEVYNTSIVNVNLSIFYMSSMSILYISGGGVIDRRLYLVDTTSLFISPTFQQFCAVYYKNKLRILFK